MAEERAFGPVRLISGANRGRYPHSNSVYVDGAGVLIDAGADEVRYRELIAGPGVREVWLSHWHEDHLAFLDLFEGLPLVQMACEAEPLSDLDAFLDWYGVAREEWRAYWRQNLRENFAFRPRRATRHFTPGEVIDLGSCTAEVILAPGHTPGHTAFFFREPQVLFMGDYDLTAFGPWYGDRAGSIEQTIASVRRLQQVPAKVWLTSHEDGCFEGDATEAFERYLAVIDEREARLLDLLSQPRTMEDIVAACIVYRKPREPKAFFEWGEGAIMGKHLERLLGKGTIALESGHYRRR
ncbi:MAG: Hydroxyacylglutathione hydrolase [Rhodocyclaceae bacterium]|nr:MAG: MBL fold metallo-hydrolase [Rhodocyclaceae bacterium]MBE7421755.1 MBL fold metallo-hydrolase [Zoogloeaceae bacterium]MBV6407820.1 Hydroxyacylglutathione hydrolase [Rhodocyclaceae bacterium]MCK6385037.1 MBL fold metallo-hydrolase [Rhodocyclaceae bacterium]CAG0946606.1 Hydroxyacylglutathione hydrolase GloC [Gammaproteobacteria bacterium]